MNKELINKVWYILPKEFKEEVKEIYLNAVEHHPCGYNHKTDLMKYLFGHHNLTSDEEGEEFLTCEKYKVEEALNYCDELDSIRGSHNMRNWGEQMIAYLFGSKCLPDAHEDNFTTEEPQPAEAKNDGTSQKQYVPKNAESCTHLDSIANNGFREHNRLHIAAMAMQGIMANSNPQMVDTNVERLVDLAILTADTLIAKCEKGGIK